MTLVLPTAPIEATPPDSWSDLEKQVTVILRECGLTVQTDANLNLARGSAKIDVLAYDSKTTPPSTTLIECKYWRKRVPKTVVHAFRTVVADSGGNSGIIVSSRGFQSGAIESAQYSNILLLTWEQFQSLFLPRWFHEFMAPRAIDASKALGDLTLFHSWRRRLGAAALTDEDVARLTKLENRHLTLISPIAGWQLYRRSQGAPGLPLRGKPICPGAVFNYDNSLPPDILDAVAYRPLLHALTTRLRAATAEFDALITDLGLSRML